MPPKGWRHPLKGLRHFKTHCVHGHDLAEVGRNTRNGCRRCERDRKKRKHEANPTPNRERCWKNYLKRTYGITPEQRELMLKAQDGKCGICGRPPKKQALHVDHDHKTGRVRDLLCYRCNRWIVGTHTIESAKQLMTYLEKHQ